MKKFVKKDRYNKDIISTVMIFHQKPGFLTRIKRFSTPEKGVVFLKTRFLEKVQT